MSFNRAIQFLLCQIEIVNIFSSFPGFITDFNKGTYGSRNHPSNFLRNRCHLKKDCTVEPMAYMI